MDFTYIVAGIISVVVGVVGGSVFLLVQGQTFWRLLATTVPVAVVLDLALLLDWSRVEPITTSFLLTDLAFFTAYSLVGCSIGALPLVVARRLYRRLSNTEGD
ncbi:hypothetical protein [Erythrobacter mangrovi]|uniref:Uncharacterized protein n=1 Tax=Erythrobacter mangrovi TaxID=2739433 RepID=A0A7D3XGV1_9SPHN|nr:hypothetical protein [Erythrobacter mangrovi]QKG70598.1 hypothetical protein HQR01_04000 [Erythrobacter mangrovi]